jgi:hypothetical protein
MDLKNAAITGIAVLAGVLLSRQLHLPQKFFGGNSREKDIATLRSKAAELNARMPRQLDSDTRVLGMDVTNDGVIYRYQINTRTKQELIDAGLLDKLRTSLPANACKQEDDSAILAHGFSVTYTYVDSGNIPVGTVTVPASQCR